MYTTGEIVHAKIDITRGDVFNRHDLPESAIVMVPEGTNGTVINVTDECAYVEFPTLDHDRAFYGNTICVRFMANL